MPGSPPWQDAVTRLKTLAAAEWRELTRLNPSERPLPMPVAAAAAIGLPIFIGAAYGALGAGLVASIGGLAFLYLPPTQLAHRMAWLMACAFGLVACYALGVLCQLYAPITVLMLTLVTIPVTMVCRFYAVPPPGSLFFVMSASIGAFTPAQGLAAVQQVGLLAMGCVLAVAIAFAYSLYMLGRVATKPPAPPVLDFEFVILESVVIGCFVGFSLALAELLQLPRPYWVPVSCLAVIQSVSVRAVWLRQIHRIVGTALGLAVFWLLATLPLTPWSVAALITTLAFVIEVLVVRHYGLAVVFITPLTILLAEAAHLGQGSPGPLMQARLIDTILGCVVGLLGGVCLHSPRFRAVVARLLRGRRAD